MNVRTEWSEGCQLDDPSCQQSRNVVIRAHTKLSCNKSFLCLSPSAEFWKCRKEMRGMHLDLCFSRFSWAPLLKVKVQKGHLKSFDHLLAHLGTTVSSVSSDLRTPVRPETAKLLKKYQQTNPKPQNKTTLQKCAKAVC